MDHDTSHGDDLLSYGPRAYGTLTALDRLHMLYMLHMLHRMDLFYMLDRLNMLYMLNMLDRRSSILKPVEFKHIIEQHFMQTWLLPTFLDRA